MWLRRGTEARPPLHEEDGTEELAHPSGFLACRFVQLVCGSKQLIELLGRQRLRRAVVRGDGLEYERRVALDEVHAGRPLEERLDASQLRRLCRQRQFVRVVRRARCPGCTPLIKRRGCHVADIDDALALSPAEYSPRGRADRKSTRLN